jgi:hypothetical protein
MAFAGAFKDPPKTTREIMEPETYLAHEMLPPMKIIDMGRDFKSYDPFDIGAMGEFDVAVLMDQYVGRALSKRMYPEWRGGYYYAAKAKAHGDVSPSPNAPLGLLYVSRWSGPAAAMEFAGIYAESLKQRYKHVSETGVPAATEPIAQEAAPGNEKSPPSLKGRHCWNTEDGAVVVEQHGDTVLVSESLNAETTATLENEVFGSLADSQAVIPTGPSARR